MFRGHETETRPIQATVMSTILIVDDELDIQATLHMVLSLEGYEVITASNGAEGLRRISEERPDLVISDVTMPSLDGLEMCGG